MRCVAYQQGVARRNVAYQKRVIDFAGLAKIRPDEGIMLLRVPVNGAVMVEEARSLIDGARDERQSGYLHTDIRSSTLARADWSEQMSLPFEEAEYGAWGETLRVSELDAPSHQFVGFEPDPATGWYFMGARVYDPELRRWLSPDPLLLAAPQVDANHGASLNLYGYADNNPVGLVDPEGTKPNVAWGGSSGCTASQPDCQRGSTPYRGKQPEGTLVGDVAAGLVKGLIQLSVAPLADAASAVNEAANGNYGPAAVSVGMAAIPGGKPLKAAAAATKAGRRELAEKIGKEVGGVVTELTTKKGFMITIPKGKRSIDVRVMGPSGQRSEPYWRASIPGKETFTKTGKVSTDPNETHMDIVEGTYEDAVKLINKIKEEF